MMMMVMILMMMVVVIKTLNFLMTGQSFSVPRRAEGEEGSRRNLEEGEMEGGAVRTSPIFSIFVFFDNNIFQIFVSTFPSLSWSGRTDGEIPDADVVTDDAAADPAAEGEGGEVCEVRIIIVNNVIIIFTFQKYPWQNFTMHNDWRFLIQVLMFDRGDGTYSLKFIQNKC